MSSLPRYVLLGCIMAGAWLSPKPCRAWIETRIESSQTSLEIGSDGAATVRYQLTLDVRGAPLRSLAFEGVDKDAEPLPDGSIIRLKGGVANSSPVPLQVAADAGHLELRVGLDKGLRGRTLLLKFGYRTRLLERGLVRHLEGGQRSELAWVGPRFPNGIDSVTLVVRTAAARLAPEVLGEAYGTAPGTANFGIVMSTLRRSQQRDELELVRAHVAREEAITWRVLLDRELFPGAAAASAAVPARPLAGAARAAAQAPARALATHTWLPWLALLAVVYALLVGLKTWWVERAARVRKCRPRPFVPWRARYRAAFAGLCLAAAAGAVLWLDAPVLAAGLMVVAIAFAAQRPPEPTPELRGPGEWRPLDPAVFRLAPPAPVPGAWLDAGRAPGFCLLFASLAGTTWAAAGWYETSPYYGACLLLGSSALLPLFCTGRLAEMPLDGPAESLRLLASAQRRLSRSSELVVQLIGRFAAQGGEIDELRLSIMPVRGLPGLIGLELGVELQERIGGFCARPVVVVRAAEGSTCQRALPRGLTWTRGRSAEERAALVKPLLPTLRTTVGLVQELLRVMATPEASGTPTASRKAARSGGNGLSTEKPGTRSSPAHAT